jgi:hypothetical protein
LCDSRRRLPVPEPDGGVVRALDLEHGALWKTHRCEIPPLARSIGQSDILDNCREQKALANQQRDELFRVIEPRTANAVTRKVEPVAVNGKLHETVDEL